MMVKLKHTLVTQFAVIILLIFVIGQGTLYVWLLFYQKAYLADQLREEVRAVAQFSASLTSRESDRTFLTQYSESLIRKGLVVSMKITRGDKTVFEKSSGSSHTGAAEEGSGLFTPFFIPSTDSLSVPFSGGTVNGTVTVVYSGRSVNEVMKRFLVIPPMMQAVTFLIIVYAIISFFRKKVTKPVQGINRTFDKITAGDLTAELPSADSEEIGSIVTGLQFLKERLLTTIMRFNALSRNVSAAMGQLTVTLGSINDTVRRQLTSTDAVIASIRSANESQKKVTENTDRLARTSSENVSSLLEMKSAAEEIAVSTERLFKSTETSYAMLAEGTQMTKSIADSASNVSHAVENTTASVEEISASLSAVRENTKQSSDLAGVVKTLLTDRGTLAAAEAIDIMEQVSGQVSDSAEIISRLDNRSKDIEKILSVIRDVTEKTNLLSLNAAILAAQAGEYGKSFSVVADEIRSLSDRTSTSAKEIATIVKTIQTEIHETVAAITKGVMKVDQGKTLIFKSSEAIGESLEAAQRSALMTQMIEKSAEEQALGLQQIRLSMEHIRTLLGTVAQATAEERRGADSMLQGIADVKEVAELVKKGTEEQAIGTDLISKNMELTLDMISEINDSARQQFRINEGIIGAVEQMKNTSITTVRDMEEVVLSFSTLTEEIEALKRELEHFKTGSAGLPGGTGI